MANPPFGGDFETLARQYWNQWGETMRNAASPPASQPSMPGWNEAVGWWSQLAQAGGASGEANEAVQRFNSQARGWFGQMQQLAAQFAGKDAGASDIASAWRQMLGGATGNPFAEVFKHMGGRGQHGPEQWVEQAAPFIEALQRQGSQWLGTPAFGFAREHQERLQKLAKAQLDYQQRNQDYNALMAEAGQDAFDVFESKLAERSEPGRQLGSARALFDLWIDSAEEAYAKIALSPRFREVYGEFVNAQMRLRGAVQSEVEHACASVGMPTRTEIDATHRKIVQLEREVRRLRDAVQGTANTRVKESAAEQPAMRRPAKKTPTRSAHSPAPASPVATRSPPAKKAPAKKSARKASAKKSASKAPAKQSTAKRPAARKPRKPPARTTPVRKVATARKTVRKATTPAARRAVSKTANRKR